MCALTCYPLLSVSLWAHCPEACLLSWLYHRQASFNFIPHCWVTNISGNRKGKNPISQPSLNSTCTAPPPQPHPLPFVIQDHFSQVNCWSLWLCLPPFCANAPILKVIDLRQQSGCCVCRAKPPLHKLRGNIWSTDCKAPEFEMFISWLAFIFFQLSKELWLKLTH